MGMVAAARIPLDDRKTMANGIRALDADIVLGSLAPVVYKPVQVCGVELKLEPLSPALGTVVHGIDLDRDLGQAEMVQFLRELWLERRVIMFRNQQHLTRDGLIQFAERFGELGAHHGERDHIPSGPQTPEGYPDVLPIQSGERYPGAASEWHSDATWSSRPPMGSVLICREAPPIGGDTNFCDGYGLWEGVRGETKERIQGLKAIHVGQPHHAMDGRVPMATHPVARTHPETGKTVLFVNRVFTRRFAEEHGMDEAVTQSLLQELFANIGRPEVTCRFRWGPGSVAMWDNRAVQHCATADFWPHRRLMERVTILDSDVERRTPYLAD
jgi:taurine dioxygenase